MGGCVKVRVDAQFGYWCYNDVVFDAYGINFFVQNMNWVLLALITAIFFGTYNFFIKVSAGHINQIVGAVILQIVAASVGGVVLLFLKMTHSPLAITSRGIWFALLAGIMVGLAEITSFYFFAKGVPASVGIPVVIGGSILVGALLGVAFLHETLTLIHYSAILLIIIGVVFLTAK